MAGHPARAHLDPLLLRHLTACRDRGTGPDPGSCCGTGLDPGSCCGPGPGCGAAALVREWRPPFPVDIALTISVHRHGGGDPTYRRDATGAIWRTSLTPDGPGTLRVRAALTAGSTGTPRRAVVTGEAWGPGAGWLLDSLPAQLGFHDDRAGFIARHQVVGELALRYEGLRVGRSGRVFEALVPAVLEQKVVGHEAHRAWRYLLAKFGTAAPGPAPAGCGCSRPRGPGRAFPPGTGTGPAWRACGPGRSSPPPRSPPGSSRRWAWTRPRRTAAWCPCPVSGPGPRLRSGSGPWATRTRLGRRLPPTERGRLDAGPTDHRRRRDAPAPGPLRRAPLPCDQAHRAWRQPPPAPRPAHVSPRLPRLLAVPARSASARAPSSLGAEPPVSPRWTASEFPAVTRPCDPRMSGACPRPSGCCSPG